MSGVHDLVGVGVGPFNLSIAALADPVDDLDTCFLEAQEAFRWHPGVMFPEARLQTSPLKDLATAVDPTNPHTFLNYLVDQGRFYQFLHADLPAVSRAEFEDYMQWASDRLSNLAFGRRVTAITSDREAFEVHVDGSDPLRATNVVLGTGPSPKVPPCAESELGETAFHGSTIALRDPDLTDRRVAVVGSGQSGADIVHAMLDGRFGEPERLDWISRRLNFKPLDEVAFTNEYFTPGYVETFHDVDDDRKPGILADQKLASDGVSPDTLRSIYRTVYEAEALGRHNPLRLLPGRELVEFAGGPPHRLGTENLLTGEGEAYQADVVVFATGYTYEAPDCLDPLAGEIRQGDHQPYALDERFRVDWRGPDHMNLYVVNGGRFSHGIAEPQLSLMPWRAATILDDVADRPVYDPDQEMDMVTWTAEGRDETGSKRAVAQEVTF